VSLLVVVSAWLIVVWSFAALRGCKLPKGIWPSKDPRNFQNLFGDLKAFGKECTQYPLHELDELVQEDFCLPDLVMWAPEL
jgi:hypothetical protein